MTMKIRADSTEWAKATVTTDHDITGKTIEVALPTTGSAPSVWAEADVLSVTQVEPGRWVATYRVLIGPASGDFVLTAGTPNYDWTVRITDVPEVPVLKTGTVQATAT